MGKPGSSIFHILFDTNSGLYVFQLVKNIIKNVLSMQLLFPQYPTCLCSRYLFLVYALLQHSSTVCSTSLSKKRSVFPPYITLSNTGMESIGAMAWMTWPPWYSFPSLVSRQVPAGRYTSLSNWFSRRIGATRYLSPNIY